MCTFTAANNPQQNYRALVSWLRTGNIPPAAQARPIEPSTEHANPKQCAKCLIYLCQSYFCA